MLKAAIQRSLVILGLGLLLAGVTARLSVAHVPTLPNPFQMTDDVQYFPAGTEFKLSREAAAMQAAKADAAAECMSPPSILPPPNHVMPGSPLKPGSGIK
jgi:hypothetical protein